MKTVEIKYIKIAKKYSNALFHSAIEAGKTEKVYNDIIFVSETIDTNEQLKNALINPIVTIEDKKDIISKLFCIHVEKITIDFINLLIENNRLECLSEVINCYNQLSNKTNNIITPIIISAIELSEEQKERIILKLESITNKKILPDYKVEPGIIGGIIIQIDDKTIDCSIKTKFDNMKKQLTKGNDYGNN